MLIALIVICLTVVNPMTALVTRKDLCVRYEVSEHGQTEVAVFTVTNLRSKSHGEKSLVHL